MKAVFYALQRCDNGRKRRLAGAISRHLYVSERGGLLFDYHFYNIKGVFM
ncbi:hypothetical protein ACLN7K_003664 [Escherichia coli]